MFNHTIILVSILVLSLSIIGYIIFLRNCVYWRNKSIDAFKFQNDNLKLELKAKDEHFERILKLEREEKRQLQQTVFFLKNEKK